MMTCNLEHLMIHVTCTPMLRHGGHALMSLGLPWNSVTFGAFHVEEAGDKLQHEHKLTHGSRPNAAPALTEAEPDKSTAVATSDAAGRVAGGLINHPLDVADQLQGDEVLNARLGAQPSAAEHANGAAKAGAHVVDIYAGLHMGESAVDNNQFGDGLDAAIPAAARSQTCEAGAGMLEQGSVNRT
ncbi:uncharacterized protein LOC109806729 [Cajanus cajan]|uniref:uncharacterized protein LOC109806729 n=1 Tax=Cajanus cajan TaxID=3821 RepID=UPI0010FB3B5A|nr:uncharacterized protein LOC109806729 [Cajanus cajan]XP_029128858.1 uncharacterized protein LOC109806729 [Cajanus cajan]XP_029128859.1 uncharacterized protein LOC109806729 [Cajanus cajan]XP_029128860.1 uncharacterized protein LOC109806729 [Cajanus cajan]XP_029128861.1 uncharacterized protein LOC109806729 [Cajanus cajan]XP_029128862.1 uncharacterized protein LOC109806729 [Cajanus cajan]